MSVHNNQQFHAHKTLLYKIGGTTCVYMCIIEPNKCKKKVFGKWLNELMVVIAMLKSFLQYQVNFKMFWENQFEL